MSHPAERSSFAVAGPSRRPLPGRTRGASTAVLGACVFLAAGTFSSGSRAQDAASLSDREQRGVDEFVLGRSLLDQGRLEEACTHFEASQRLVPSVNTLLNLGNCYQFQGNPQRAYETFEQALLLVDNHPVEEREALTKEATSRRDKLAPTLALVPSSTPGARVQINGRAVNAGGEPLRLKPGKYRLEVSAPGKRAHVQELSLVAGQKLEISLPALSDHAVAAPTPTPVSTPFEAASSGARDTDEKAFGALPLGLMIGGGALFATGIVTGLMANSKAGELEDECPTKVNCSAGLEDTRDSASTLATVTDVLWLGGILTAGVGVTLFIVDSGREAPSASQASISTNCTLSSCALTARGHF